MALNFPANPSLNDQYSINGKTWIYDGKGWKLKTLLVPTYASNHANAAFDHANAAFDAANTGGGGGGSGNAFSIIYTSNNNVFINATSTSNQINFIGESGVVVAANSDTFTITVAGTPGAQGLTVDYGSVVESINYTIDYGSSL